MDQSEFPNSESPKSEPADTEFFAHDLHDTVMPYLFAASASVARLADDARPGSPERLTPGQRCGRLEQVESWIAAAMSASRELMQAGSRHAGIAADWCAELQRTADELIPDLTVHWNLPIDDTPRPASLALTAYRTTFEALRNVARHTDSAAEVTVTASAGGGLDIRICDDGPGYSPPDAGIDSSSAGTGIRSMRNRVRAVGGTIQWSRRNPTGTEVRICIPGTECGGRRS